MRGGDISNAASPRMWFVWEGFVGIEVKPLPNRTPRNWDRAAEDHYVLNNFVLRRAWDLAFRYDVQLSVVTFLWPDGQGWAAAVQRMLDRHTAPLTVFAVDFEVFVHEIVPSPGVYRVFDSNYERVGAMGGKATLVDASSDFDPIS